MAELLEAAPGPTIDQGSMRAKNPFNGLAALFFGAMLPLPTIKGEGTACTQSYEHNRWRGCHNGYESPNKSYPGFLFPNFQKVSVQNCWTQFRDFHFGKNLTPLESFLGGHFGHTHMTTVCMALPALGVQGMLSLVPPLPRRLLKGGGGV